MTNAWKVYECVCGNVARTDCKSRQVSLKSLSLLSIKCQIKSNQINLSVGVGLMEVRVRVSGDPFPTSVNCVFPHCAKRFAPSSPTPSYAFLNLSCSAKSDRLHRLLDTREISRVIHYRWESHVKFIWWSTTTKSALFPLCYTQW
jgi:hypothetical protein